MSRQTANWLLLVIIIVGVGLRSYQLTARSLWFDEAFSWRLTQFPWLEMMIRAAADVHPPLYYSLLKGWTIAFGSSLLALRSFSITAAAAATGAGYLFVASAFRSRPAGLLAAWLLALSPWEITFAWEARMYTLGMTLALLSSWLLLRAVRHPGMINWILYSVLVAAFAYTHYFAFFTIAAQLLFVAGYIIVATRGEIREILQSRLAGYAVLGVIIMIALYSPWLPTFFTQFSQVQAAYWVPPIGPWSIPDTFYRVWLPTNGIPSHHGWGILTTSAAIVLTIIGWLLLLVFSRLLKDARVLIVLLGVVPFLLAIAVSSFGRSLYQDRFLVFAHLFMVVGLAALMMSFTRPLGRSILIGLVTLWFGRAGLHYWQELDIAHKPGAHAATKAIYSARKDNQPVIISSPFVFFAIDYYAKKEFGSDQAKLLSTDGELAHFAGGPISTPQDLISPEIFNTSASTLWLVDTTGFGGRETTVPSGWKVTEKKIFPEVFRHQGKVIVRRLEKSTGRYSNAD